MAGSGGGGCSRLGIEQRWWNGCVRSNVLPLLDAVVHSGAGFVCVSEYPCPVYSLSSLRVLAQVALQRKAAQATVTAYILDAGLAFGIRRGPRGERVVRVAP